MFAALSPRTAHLVDGVTGPTRSPPTHTSGSTFPTRAASRSSATHGRSATAFGSFGAPYLASVEDTQIDYNQLGPESSRRARALPIWATLRAYGRAGHREMVERHLDLAAQLGRLVTDSPDLELLAPVQLCIVCFRYRPPGVPEERLDELNSRLGGELLADGRVYAGTTVYRNHVALRPAIVNWRTTQRDIDLLVDVVRELGARISSSG